MHDYVFGYGSLMSPRSANVTLQRPDPPADMQPVSLHGYQRVWNVAIRRRFVDDPPGQVSVVVVLGIEPAAGVAMVGVVFPVDADELARLDVRERHYDRIDVSDVIAPGPAGRVWTYLPKPTFAQPSPNAVIAQTYLDEIDHGCQLLGEAFTRRYHETTRPHSWPIRTGQAERVRVDTVPSA